MAEHKDAHAEKDFLLRAQHGWNQYQKPIITGIAAIVIVVGGWMGYERLIVQPKEEKAANAIYVAQRYFEVDSSRKVLDGDGVSKGVLYVIKNYGGTKEANLAHYYAGISYLKLGDFNNAVKYLKDFSTDAHQVQMLAYGALGDAYSELNKNDEAISFYKKAGAEFEKDQPGSTEFLFRAALLSEATGKNKEALELFKEIRTKFPKYRGAEMDKYIYRLSIEKNDLSVK